MTPRERAEEWLCDLEATCDPEAVKNIVVQAIITDRRELLAEDEATIEACALAMWRNGECEEYDDFHVAFKIALTALRRLRGVETDANNGDK